MATKFRRKAETLLTGVAAMDRRLVGLQRGMANQVARAALTAGARMGAKLVKAQLKGKRRKLRKAIGSKVKRAKGGVNKGFTEARFGAAVGKKKSKQEQEAVQAKEKSKTGGVGISSANIHWYIQGTRKRTNTAGRSTGRMPADQIVKRAAASGKGRIFAAMRLAGEKKLEQLRVKLLATK